MIQVRTGARRGSVAVAVLASVMVAGLGVLPASANHQTVTVKGSAFGYWADNISLFGGAQPDTGPTPSVALAADASNSPQSATAASGLVQYGPAYLFTSRQIDVTTSGSLGGAGSVASSTNINDVNTSRVEIFGEDNYDCCVPNGSVGAGETKPAVTPRPLTDVASTCSASTTGTSGSTTLTNGWLYLDSGWTDGDALYPEPAATAGGLAEHDPVKVSLPANPAPGTTYTGHIHLSATSTDNYEVVFNEQVRNPDGSLTVNAVHQYFGVVRDAQGNRVTDAASTLKGELTLGQTVCGARLAAGIHKNNVADFDGNGTTDISVFRPSSGAWFVRAGTPEVSTYGASGDVALPADYDGDGKTDTAVFRPSVGTWYIHNSGNGTDTLMTYGISTDIPVPADYDGDGKADIAVFRPSTAAWYVHQSSNNADVILTYGISGDIPVVGDYDGDARADIAVYRPSSGGWFVHRSSGGDTSVTYGGSSGDIPVPGDYDGDGKTDTAIYRPSVGTWYLHNSGTNTDSLFTYGVGADQPQPGDYDGDGKTDIGVFRPSSATWYVANSATGTNTIVTYGVPGDVALPLPHAIRRFFF